MNSPVQARRKLLLLAALFFTPVIAAILIFYYAPQWFSGRVNYGTLISPARAVPQLGLTDVQGMWAVDALKGKWSLVYLAGDTCDDDCQDRLVLARQVRLSLNQNRGRVQRLYLAPTPAALAAARKELAEDHPDLVFLARSGNAASEFFEATDPHALYLLDPLGNWLMVYAGDVAARGLQRDLKKLLRVSRVG
jgi:hypothetical protein